MIYCFLQHVSYFICVSSLNHFAFIPYAMFFTQIYILTCRYVQIYMLQALCHVFLCFVPLLFQVDVRVTCSHTCMMLQAMPCLDLCVLCVYFHAIWLDPCLHMLICLDLCSSMSMCQVSICLHICLYAYMTRSMFSHAYVLGSMFSTCFILSSMCSCALCHVCVPRPRLCLSYHVLLQPFFHFVLLSCVLAYWFRPDLDPIVFITVRTTCPISKGLDHPYLHVYACLLLCFMLVIASLVLGFATLDALSGFVAVWLRLMPMRPCLDVTIQDVSP